MTLPELLLQYNVRVMNRQNSEGLVTIGVFGSYAEAEQFMAEVKLVAGCRIPNYGVGEHYAIDPVRETKPENQHWNELADQEAEFKVSVHIGKEDPLFLVLIPPITSH